MTAIFKIKGPGALQGVQVGPQDVVAVLSAASSAWGWVGGLQGTRAIIEYGRQQFGLQTHSTIFRPPALSPASCKFLTFDGIATFEDSTTDSFGGDDSTQMVGLTLCALAHELKLDDAVEVFMTYLAPTRFRGVFDKCTGSQEALQTQLLDNGRVILNEGAARGFPRKFNQAWSKTGLLKAAETPPTTYNQVWPSDRQMVGGLLKWIGRGCIGSYHTRSAVVVRVATYLKEVGYAIGIVRSWNGQGQKPQDFRAVILVTGGSSETDTCVDTEHVDASFSKLAIISHYMFATTGAMLLNTLRGTCELAPEVVQQYYEDIQTDISQRLDFQWTYTGIQSPADGFESDIKAIPKWKGEGGPLNRIAMRLASFYFPRAAEYVAPYYEAIAQEEVLRTVKLHIDRDDQSICGERFLLEFRIHTVSILLAVISRLGGPDFDKLRHATMLSLRWSRSVKNFAQEVEILLISGLSFSRVSRLVAHIHCGKPAPAPSVSMTEEDIYYDGTAIVGWRHGSYAVLPALLSQMASGPSISVLGFQCFDAFIGNIPVQKDDSVRSGQHGTILLRDNEPLKSVRTVQRNDDLELQIRHPRVKISVGPAISAPPDVPLYLNIERPIQIQGPILGLCGRVDGYSIGNVGVLAVLRTLLRSFDDIAAYHHHQQQQQQTSVYCSRHSAQSAPTAAMTFFMVPPSEWCKSPKRPTGEPDFHTFVPVQGDAAWALFLAGETDARICLCCADCAVRGAGFGKDEAKVVLIAY